MSNNSSTLERSEFYPRNIALSQLPDQDYFELLVVRKQQVGALDRIAGVFSMHNIPIMLSHGNYNTDAKLYVSIFYCDFREANCTIQQVTEELKQIPVVVEVDFQRTKDRLFDRFLFPVTIMNKFRVLVMRVEPLLGIERKLMERFGSAGESIMFEEGKSYGMDTLRQYREILPNASVQVLLENVRDGLRATGWGLFEFKTKWDGVEVAAKDPPVSSGNHLKESRFLLGVIAGVFEYLNEGSTMELEEEARYDEKARTLFFKLRKHGAEHSSKSR